MLNEARHLYAMHSNLREGAVAILSTYKLSSGAVLGRGLQAHHGDIHVQQRQQILRVEVEQHGYKPIHAALLH